MKIGIFLVCFMIKFISRAVTFQLFVTFRPIPPWEHQITSLLKSSCRRDTTSCVTGGLWVSSCMKCSSVSMYLSICDTDTERHKTYTVLNMIDEADQGQNLNKLNGYFGRFEEQHVCDENYHLPDVWRILNRVSPRKNEFLISNIPGCVLI